MRLEKSRYKNNIILKGGLLLASIVGDDERTTKDKESIRSIFEEILSISKYT